MFLIPVIILLAIVIYQDFRFREIWWFTPPLLFVGGLGLNWEQLNWEPLVLNAAFIAILLAFLLVYVRIRFKSQNLFKEYFGIGDALILIAITPFFDFPYFIYFFTGATIISLVGFALISLFKAQKTIPYAGYIAISTLAFLLLSYWHVNPFISEQ